jgi:hypothetical protein
MVGEAGDKLLFRQSKGPAKDIKTNITTPNTIQAIDFMNMKTIKSKRL